MTVLTGKSKQQTKLYKWCCHVCGEERGLTFLHVAGGKVAACKKHKDYGK